jgi:ATP-dependent HslUV protease ATP-binding subunit HslU
MERLLEDISFDADQRRNQTVVIDKAYVDKRLHDIVEDPDLSRYIL